MSSSMATRLMIYMEKRLKGFEPIVSENSRVLILGSMPSVVSLEKQEYYGFKHNRFWKIMGLYAGCRWESYEMKKRFILQEGFALWDVIDSCEREGSLDSKIKNIICSDIDGLLKQYPKIHMVILNGQKAAELLYAIFFPLSFKGEGTAIDQQCESYNQGK